MGVEWIDGPEIAHLMEVSIKYLLCLIFAHTAFLHGMAEMYSTYRKVPVVGKQDFELWGCSVKISQYLNKVPRLILRFHIFLNLNPLGTTGLLTPCMIG